jgi:hypothetical protein
MDRYSNYVAEEDAVAALPLCVRRLRGPGRARRLPPGSAYRSAGAVLRRVLLYSEDGQARVQVVRSDGLGTGQEIAGAAVVVDHSSATASPLPFARGGGGTTSAALTRSASSPSTKLPPSFGAVGLFTEEQDEDINISKASHVSSQDANEVHTNSQLRRERAATLAAETERRYEEEQESTLASVLHALPLLRVVPPLSLQQQAYSHEAPPALTLNNTHNTASSSSSYLNGTFGLAVAGGLGSSNVEMNQSSATNATGRNPGQLPPSVLLAAELRYGATAVAVAARSSRSADGGGSGADLSNTILRDRRGLGLSTAVLLSKAEMEEWGEARESFTETTATACTQPPLTPPPPTPPPPPAALSSSSSVSPGDAALSLTSEEKGGEDAVADATTAVLNDVFIDGGLGATIKLGASCDEPNSLRYVTWGGCKPVLLRAVVWRLLSDYAPVQVARQYTELQRKRRQYEGYTRQYCSALTMLAVSGPPTPPSATQGGSLQRTSGSPNRDSASLSRLPVLPKSGQGISSSPGNPSVLNSRVGPASAAVATASSSSSLAPHERAIIHQMLLDLPRHQASIFHARRSVAGMARCLFLWSQRHPAVGYVQGMDDVVAIFYQVFLTDALRQHARERLSSRGRCSSSTSSASLRPSPSRGGARHVAADVQMKYTTQEGAPQTSERSTREIMRLLLASLHRHRPGTAASSSVPPTTNVATASSMPTSAAAGDAAPPPLSPFLTEADVDVYFRTPAALDAALADLPENYLTQVEADTFFCAGRVLSFLQDNFMTGQPGILRNVRRLEGLLRKVDPAVVALLEEYGLTVMDGCFQWLHCLLVRELPLPLVLRLWDCYLAIGVGGERPMNVSASAANTGAGSNGMSISGGGALAGSSASDEAIMYFHVCVCCALMRALRSSLMDGVASSTTAAAPTASSSSTVGGWAAALVTALPGFRSRASHNGNNTHGSSGGDGDGASSFGAKPSIDVVMTTLKRPFDALFPNYTSTAAKARRRGAEMQQQHQYQQQQQQGKNDAMQRGSSLARPFTLQEESLEEAAAERWLDLLIADAYCIWRLHPLTA